MKKLCLALLAMATALAITPRAMADTIFDIGTVASVDVDLTASGLGTSTATVTITELNGHDFSEVFLNSSGIGANTPTVSAYTAPMSETLTWNANQSALGRTFTGGFTGSPNDSFSSITIHLVGDSTTDWTSASQVLTLTTGTPGYDAAVRYGTNGTEGTPDDTDLAGYETITPEPSSLVLLGSGLLGLAFVAFRKAKASGVALNI